MPASKRVAHFFVCVLLLLIRPRALKAALVDIPSDELGKTVSTSPVAVSTLLREQLLLEELAALPDEQNATSNATGIAASPAENQDTTNPHGSNSPELGFSTTATPTPRNATDAPRWPRVLVLNTAVGWRHSSLRAAAAMMEQHAEARHWALTLTGDDVNGHVSTAEDLLRYDVVVLLATTGAIFGAAERAAFRGYVRLGGAVAGVHSAIDTNRDWAFFRDLFGARLSGHPDVQWGEVVTEDRAHTTASFLPARWAVQDEFYNFEQPFAVADKHVVLALDERSYAGGQHPRHHPLSWTRAHGAARAPVWYTALGHAEKVYASPEWCDRVFREHVARGVEWAAAEGRLARERALAQGVRD